MWQKSQKSRKAREADDLLEKGVAAWRDDPDRHVLSGAARAHIVRATLGGRDRADRAPVLAPLATLFMPATRLAFAAVMPALLVALVVGYLASPSRLANHEVSRSAKVAASKHEGDVVFVIANGKRSHRVFRSDGHILDTADGTFRDELDAGPYLVFYQID